MKKYNLLSIFLFVLGTLLVIMGLVIQSTLDMLNGQYLLVFAGCVIFGIILAGLAEIIRIVHKILLIQDNADKQKIE